jgi:hypothetical protein
MMHQLRRSQHHKNKINPLIDYKGSDLQTVLNSILELFTDDARALGLSQLLETHLWINIQKWVKQYLDLTGQNINKVKTSKQAADLADRMKDDDKTVQNLIKSIFTEVSMDPTFVGELTNLVYSPDGCVGYSLCSSCPYYLKSSICIVADRSFDGGWESNQTIAFSGKLHLSSSILMAKVMINIFHYAVMQEGNLGESLMKFKVLMEDLQLIMGAYKSMNPTGEIIRQQEENLLNILTSKRIDIEEEEEAYMLDLLDSVFEDVKSSNKSYVRDMQKCMSTIRAEMSKGYTEDDYYISMKATSQIREGEKGRKSILNSVLERDTYVSEPAVIAFDNFVGYKSHYLKETDTLDRPIKTIMIQNPGKFKMRGIHISENAIQDRCNYIHRCIKRGLSVLKSDCSQNQQEGREFAQRLTLQWSVEEEPERIGIYCLDFSNATDTMDQELQCRVLEFLMGPEVSNYWRFLSQSKKTFVFNDGTSVDYLQLTGQPQGLLGSFDAFSIAHHFMMLMVMKMCNFEDRRPEEFYRVLGDDSIINTIEPEFDLELDEISVLDSYKRVCSFANFLVNDDKGVYTHYNSLKALASFAKVDYLNGVNFSPTPYRLATLYLSNKLEQTEHGHLAVAIWRTQVGYFNYEKFLEQSMSHFPDGKWIVRTLYSGYATSVSPRFTNRFNLTDSQRARTNYSLVISILDSTMSSIFMGDLELSFKNPKKPRRSFEDLFKLLPEKELEEIPMDHKIFSVLEKNSKSDKFLSELLGFDNLDDICIRICCELIENGFNNDIDDKYTNLLSVMQTFRIIKQAANNPLVDVSQVFPEAALTLTSTLKEMKMGLMTRGLTKQPTRISYIFREAYSIYKGLGETLGYLQEDNDVFGQDNPENPCIGC